MAITNKAKKVKATRINKIIKQWTNMLTSGDYKKTTGTLHKVKNDKHSYCCLGVLCELALKEGVISKKSVKRDYDGDSDVVMYIDDDSELPEKVRVWAGLSESLGEYKAKNHKTTSLAEVNDSGKKSFKDIAEIIKSRPEGLFVE